MYTVNNAAGLDPTTVGGDTARNQVIHQSKYAIGPDSNGSRVYRFKIPKKFQRIREGRRWTFTWRTSATVTSSIMSIYKVYG